MSLPSYLRVPCKVFALDISDQSKEIASNFWLLLIFNFVKMGSVTNIFSGFSLGLK